MTKQCKQYLVYYTNPDKDPRNKTRWPGNKIWMCLWSKKVKCYLCEKTNKFVNRRERKDF